MRRAFTLIEVLITTTLFLVLVFGITKLYVTFGRMVSFGSVSIQASLSASAVLDAVHSAGLQAARVAVAHDFSGTNLSSGTTTAVFELPSIDASGLTISGAYDYVGIYASGTDAYRVIDASAGSARISGEKQLSSNLDALSFSYDNADLALVRSVVVDATTTAAVPSGSSTKTHLRERVYLRN